MKIFLIIVVAIGIAVAVFLFKNKSVIAPEDGSPTACSLDAQRCPDGSYVGRQGPNCDFATCPTATPTVSQSAKPTTSSTPNPSPSPTVTPASSGQTVTITFANEAAAPNMVAIKVGDTVKFVNNDTVLRWPASGPHPTHTTCPGFDSLRGLKTGESYSFTFLEVKTCPWHDHLKPSVNGKIEVTQ